MKKCVCLLMLLMLLLTGCAEESIPKISFDNVETIPIQDVTEIPEFELTFGSSGKYTDEGVFFAVNDSDTPLQTLYFTDSSTDEIYPLCSRPNCAHDSEECPARLEVSNLHFDGEFLYFVEGSSFQGECIMRQRADGSDREILFRQEAGKNGSAKIHSTFYQGDTLYFTTFGSVFDPETGKLTTGERICIGNLNTGKMRILPMEFGQGNGTTLAILGKYGNELLIQRQFGGSGLIPERNYHEAFFFLDLDTCEITMIAEFTFDDKRSWDMVGQSLLYFKLDWSEPELIMSHESEGNLQKQTCDVIVVDLEKRTGYRKNSIKLTKSMLSNEFYVFYDWNEGFTEFTKMIKDLRSGEIRPFPQNMPYMINMVRAGESIYFELKDENGQWCAARILEEDFWNGNPNYHIFPEWARYGIIF